MKKQTIYIFMLTASSFFPFGKNTLAQKQQDKTQQAKQMLQKTGIRFTENKGQLADEKGRPMSDVRFTADVAGNQLYLRSTGTSYVFSKRELVKEDYDKSDEKMLRSKKEHTNKYRTTEMYRMDMELIGANPNAQIIGEQATEDICNYYLPSCPNGIFGVKNYHKVVYQNIYPKIDLVYYIKGEKMEYDFVVHPGANPANIRMKYTGAESLQLAEDGSLIAKTPLGEVKENTPYSFLRDNKNKVNSNFKLENGELSFALANYDHSKTLVIDPVYRIWGTYYGGTNEDQIFALETDSQNNIVVGGHTESNLGISTAGGYQSNSGGIGDGFIAKFNSSGQRQWATYYGGTNPDDILALAIDNANNIVVGGATQSNNNISTSGSHQAVHGGGNYDGFLVKFNPLGQRQWATYYGGVNWDQIHALTIDSQNNIVVGGVTQSNNNISTQGTHQTTFGGYNDCFIAKFNPLGQRQWATYYGEIEAEDILALAIDNANNIVVGGHTFSSNNIATPGSHQAVFGGAGQQPLDLFGGDGFIAKFNPLGQRQWATYYGGAGRDEIRTLAIDSQNNIVVGGGTMSSNNIATPESYQPIHGEFYEDAFIAKFNPLGQRQWATYYGGGTDDDIINALSIDSQNNIVVGGHTNSLNNIATPGSNQVIFGGDIDGFIAKFNPLGQRQWGTYYGGIEEDKISALAIDNQNKIIIGGWTYSTTNIATSGSHQAVHGGGNYDGFLVKFGGLNISSINGTVCSGNTISVSYTSEVVFNSGNVFTVQVSNANGSFDAGFTNIGLMVSTNNSGVIVCTIPANMPFSTLYRIRIISSNPSFIGDDIKLNSTVGVLPLPVINPTSLAICDGEEGILSTTKVQGYTYQWKKSGVNIPGATSHTLTVMDAGSYSVTASNQCFSKTSSSVTVKVLQPTVIPGKPCYDPLVGEQASEMSLQPNPANDQFEMEVQLSDNTSVQLDIVNALGEVLYTHSETHKKGTFRKTIDVSSFVPGIYFVNLKTAGNTFTEKLMIAK